jgi:hypothetical protein
MMMSSQPSNTSTHCWPQARKAGLWMWLVVLYYRETGVLCNVNGEVTPEARPTSFSPDGPTV